MFVEKHRIFFENSLSEFFNNKNAWAGFSARSLFSYMAEHNASLHLEPNLISDKKITRDDLYERVLDADISDYNFIVDVLSWGGVDRRYAAKALSQKYSQGLTEIVGSLRRKSLSSEDAYSAFKRLREQHKLPGIGPAYYTKLIFFSSPKHDGFIMDQWTARSINLLLGRNLIITKKHSRGVSVTDENTSDIYAQFCDCVRLLTNEIDGLDDPKLTEEALFSRGGRANKKCAWRKYVINNT